MTRDMRKKVATSFTLKEETREMLRLLSEGYELSQSTTLDKMVKFHFERWEIPDTVKRQRPIRLE